MGIGLLRGWIIICIGFSIFSWREVSGSFVCVGLMYLFSVEKLDFF
jgi:hypothetical protein